MRVSCPACGGTTFVHRSRLITPTTRESDCVCKDPDCAWSGTAMTTIAKTKSPGLKMATKPQATSQLDLQLDRHGA